MDEADLKRRTKQFGLRCMKLVDGLPTSTSGRAVANQLVRSATSVGANYRSACRGRSKAEFVAKLGIVEEEVDESAFWLEIIIESGMKPARLIHPLIQEATELTRIVAASIRTSRLSRSSIQNPQSKIQNA